MLSWKDYYVQDQVRQDRLRETEQERLVIEESLLAGACFQRSADIFREIGAEDELARSLRPWARHEMEMGDKEEGKKIWEEARAIFMRLEMPAEVERMEEGE